MIVGGAAAEGSQANRRLVQDRDQADPARRGGCVCALARTGKTAAEKTSKPLVAPGPQTSDHRTRGPRAQARRRRKTLWTFPTRWGRRQSGEGTGLLSTRGRNLGPTPTQILVTTLAELPSSPGGGIDHKRWASERLHWERQSGLGVGEPHVSEDKKRREQSVGMAVLASWCVLRLGPHESIPGKPWSSFPLQQALRLRGMTNQVEHTVKVTMAKTRKAA